jgi:hypothetical protein
MNPQTTGIQVFRPAQVIWVNGLGMNVSAANIPDRNRLVLIYITAVQADQGYFGSLHPRKRALPALSECRKWHEDLRFFSVLGSIPLTSTWRLGYY